MEKKVFNEKVVVYVALKSHDRRCLQSKDNINRGVEFEEITNDNAYVCFNF